MFACDRPAVAAIVNWEMSTIGDPVLDLGSLIAAWPEYDGGPDLVESAPDRAGGLPGTAELVVRYAGHSARDLTAIDCYVVLACFRLGIVLEGDGCARAGRPSRQGGRGSARLAHGG